MKTIVVFSAYYYPHLGGIERYIDHMMHQFISKGKKVVLVTSNYNNAEKIEIIDNIRIIRLPVYNRFKNRYPLIKHNREQKQLIKELDNYDIESIIVNTRFHLTSHIGADYGKKHNIPVYLIEHGSSYVTLDNKLIDFFANIYEKYLTYKIKKKITGFYGVSKAASDWIKEFNIKANGVWYNSIDVNKKLPRKKRHKEINFLYAGRLIKQKGVLNILNAFSKLEKKYNNIHLYIAGDGPEYDKYQKKFRSKRISFLGALTHNELFDYYAITDIFLYPPLWPEGLPTSILEAGLMKCSVIGTNQGGIKEIIMNNKNGLVISGTEKSLFDGMEKLIKNKNLRKELSNTLYEDILNKFSWDVTSDKILEDIRG